MGIAEWFHGWSSLGDSRRRAAGDRAPGTVEQDAHEHVRQFGPLRNGVVARQALAEHAEHQLRHGADSDGGRHQDRERDRGIELPFLEPLEHGADDQRQVPALEPFEQLGAALGGTHHLPHHDTSDLQLVGLQRPEHRERTVQPFLDCMLGVERLLDAFQESIVDVLDDRHEQVVLGREVVVHHADVGARVARDRAQRR